MIFGVENEIAANVFGGPNIGSAATWIEICCYCDEENIWTEIIPEEVIIERC